MVFNGDDQELIKSTC